MFTEVKRGGIVIFLTFLVYDIYICNLIPTQKVCYWQLTNNGIVIQNTCVTLEIWADFLGNKCSLTNKAANQ